MTPASGPSQHLTWAELACHDRFRSPYPQDWRGEPTRAVALAKAFEDIRSECSVGVAELTQGRIVECPIVVTEGYRTLGYQEMLRTAHPEYRAAKKSQHVEGRAIDLACPRLLPYEQFVLCVKRAASRIDSPIRYLEVWPARLYVHVDVRPTQRLVVETIA